MTGKNLEASLEELGLTKGEFARLVGLSARTIRLYTSKSLTNEPVSILATLLVQQKLSIADIQRAKRGDRVGR